MRRLVWLGAALLALSGRAAAHDVWLSLDGEAQERRVIVNYGHPEDRPPAFVDKVVDLVAIRSAGVTSLRAGLSLAEQSGAIVARSKPFSDDGHAVFAARYDNGFWVKAGDTFINATRRSMPEATESLWSGKFAKAISGPGAPWDKDLGHNLELVPLADPARVAPAGSLKVRVLFRGKPLQGVEVERSDSRTAIPEADIPRFRTDKDGIATIPIVRSGPTLLVVDHRVSPSRTPDQAKADLYNATFWFEVKAQP